MSTNGTNGSGPAADDAAAAPQDQQAAQVKMQILGQFIRDLSFENILAQKGVTGDVKPDVQVQVNLDAKKRQVENQYEVISKYVVTSKNTGSDAVLFHLELEYSGIFLVEGIPDQQLHAFLMVECPRQLFPFARRIISDVTRDGGFPPLNLDTVDFLQIYRSEIQRRAAQQKADADASPEAEASKAD